jgi:transposase
MDLRRGMDGLSAWVQEVLQWDSNGVWLCQRRLHRGHFVWPRSEDRSFSITQEEWQWLITGVEWQRLSAKTPVHWRV